MLSGDSEGLSAGAGRGARSGQADLCTFEQHLPGEAMGLGRGMRMGGLSRILPLLWDHGLHREPPRLLCSLPAPQWRGRERRQRQSRAPGPPCCSGGEAAPSQAGAQERIPDPSTQR